MQDGRVLKKNVLTGFHFKGRVGYAIYFVFTFIYYIYVFSSQYEYIKCSDIQNN